MTKEEWRPVRGYEGLYSVSSLGRVRSEERFVRHNRGGLARKAPLVRALFADKDGYRKVVLSAHSRSCTFSVHSLVLAAFVEPRPDGMVACHNNGDPSDNRPENLRWDTLAGNFADKLVHGTHSRGERNGCSKLTDEQRRAIVRDARKPRFIARDYGISTSLIFHLRYSRLWRAA